MNIVEDFDAYRASSISYFDKSISGELPNGDGSSLLEYRGNASAGPPLLSVNTAVKQTARGRGDVVGVSCANGNVLVATSRGYIIRYFWDDMGNERVSELEITRQPDTHIVGVFVDSTANHILVSMRGPGGAPELHYAHRRWPKSRLLSKFKGMAVTAVAWCRGQEAGEDDSRHSSSGGGGSAARGSREEPSAPSSTCTGPILLGTESGSLLEVELDERLLQQKKEPSPRQLMQSVSGSSPPSGSSSSGSDAARPICGLHQEAVPDSSKYLVLVATPSQLYALVGGPSLESLFARYTNARPTPVLEAVAPSSRSQLHLYYPTSLESKGWDDSPLHRRPSRFAWLVGNMVYHGELDLEGGEEPGACLRNTCSLPLPGATAPPASELGPVPSRVSSMSPPPVSPASANGAAAASAGAAAAVTNPEDDDAQSLAMTAFHFIVLCGDQLFAVNRVSGRVVAEVGFRSPITKSVSGEPSRSIDGLVKDDVSGTMYVYSDESLYEVSVLQEGRDMWRVYLQQHDWDAALAQCTNNIQRDQVHCSWADAAMEAGDTTTAAIHYAKIVGGRPPFEDIALKFVEAAQREQQEGLAGSASSSNGSGPESQDALALFLSTKLSVLGRSDRAQATMVAAWLTELYLDQINRELLESGGKPSARYQAQEDRLRCFLTSGPSLETLDPGTTCSLLAGYGRMEDLVAFAAARADHEAVLEYLMQHPQMLCSCRTSDDCCLQSASKALAVMRKPSCSTELIYKFAPGLVAAVTEEAIDFFVTFKPPLDPRRLIPAMLRFGEPGSSPEGRRHVLRFVQYVVEQLGCEDAAVHNLAVALHSLGPGEAPLLSYLARAHDGLGRPLYDVRHALRLAMERGKQRACVKLLCGLGMYEDAVSLALSLDLELAKTVAGMLPEEEEGMRRRLWLAVAKHVVQQGAAGSGSAGGAMSGSTGRLGEQQAANIKQAVEFLREAGGLLKLEDILPFFPDFVTIDNFKDAICDSLERYNRQIEELRREMGEATQIADAVRRDLKLLSTRTAALSSDHPCTRCGRALAMPPAPCGLPTGGAVQPFFAFPTGLAYHGVCCAAEVVQVANPQQQARIKGLLARLSKAKRQGARAIGDEEVQALQQQLAAEVASEDPRNGEVTVRLVDLPFVLEADQEQQALWAI